MKKSKVEMDSLIEAGSIYNENPTFPSEDIDMEKIYFDQIKRSTKNDR